MNDSQPGGSYGKAYREAVEQLSAMRDASAVEQIEKIIACARENGDEVAVIAWLRELLEVASHYARFDREIEAFHELMRIYQSDRSAAELRRALLWHFKWLMERVPEFLEVGVEQVDALFGQMEAFYRQEGESLAPLYALRFRSAAFMGHASAGQWRQRWASTDPGESDDCPACQTHTHVQALLDMDEVVEALSAAEPILRGEQNCEEVPATTFSRLLLPAMLTGETEMAAAMHRVVRRQVRLTPKLLSHLADHLVFLVLVGGPQNQYRHAVLLLRGLPGCTNAFDRFCAVRAAWLWSARRRKSGLPLHLPAPLQAALPAEAAADLPAWCEAQTRDLASRFDARNGSDRFRRMMTEAEAIVAMDVRH